MTLRRRGAATIMTLAAAVVVGGCGHTTAATSPPRSTTATTDQMAPTATSTVTPTATTAPGSPTTPGDGGPGPTNPDISPGVPGSYLGHSAANVSEVPTSDGPGQSTATVTVIHPTTADSKALAAASVQNFAGCSPYAVKGTVHIATIDATGVSWAIAGINGPDGCVGAWFYDTAPPPAVGAFERQPGGAWQFNSEVGKPFPCPLPEGNHTGAGSPYVPAEVLQAWQIPYYSSNCLPTVPQDTG